MFIVTGFHPDILILIMGYTIALVVYNYLIAKRLQWWSLTTLVTLSADCFLQNVQECFAKHGINRKYGF